MAILSKNLDLYKMEKICSGCKKPKEFKEFNKNRSCSDGMSRHCKECTKQNNQKHYLVSKDEHKDRRAQTNANAVKKAQRFMIGYLNDHPCIDCSNLDIRVLEFDHLRNKDQNISALVTGGYSIKRIQEEIEKCEVVCANCHRIRTFERAENFKQHYYIGG